MSDSSINKHVCVRYLVAGRVQGVFYRASARHEAQQLGLTGYARNLLDGRVEVVACGDKKAVDALQEWLRRGPANAQVTGVASEYIDYRDFVQFTVS
ncbi:MAG: acylphosphatase [Candidatus Thiodiazotropha sp.]